LKQSFKNSIKHSIQKITLKFSVTRIGRVVNDIVIEDVMNRVQRVQHNDIEMKFAAPNIISGSRAESFSTKEPETLEWIESIPEASILWDIGANVGLYSVYAAILKKCQVIAIEPSIFNLELLARNIYLNKLQEQISILPIALSDSLGFNIMKMTSTEWGGALSTFGKNIGEDGGAISEIFSYQMMGITIDDAISKLKIPKPDYIKMDVDGIEHFILKGGTNTLGEISGILIEINDDFKDQSKESKEILEDMGLVLVEKRHGVKFDDKNSRFHHTYNQIWTRKEE
jgi:FkbM family methyltransferase